MFVRDNGSMLEEPFDLTDHMLLKIVWTFTEKVWMQGSYNPF